MIGTNSVTFRKESVQELKRFFRKKLPNLRNFSDVMDEVRASSWDDVLKFMTAGYVSWHKRMRVYRYFNTEEQLKFLSLLSPQFLKKFMEHLSYDELEELKERMKQRGII